MDICKIESIWFENEICEELYEKGDSNGDVIFCLSNHTRWVASFFTYKNILSLSQKNKITGECLNGLYFCASDMILIEELNKENIQKVLEELIKNNKIELYCTKLGYDDSE